MIGRNCLKSNPMVEDFFRADWFRPGKREKCWEFTRKKKICGRKVFQKYLICAIFDVADRQHRGALRMLAVFSAGVQKRCAGMTLFGIEYNRKRDDDSVTKKRLFCVPFCKIVPPKKRRYFCAISIEKRKKSVRW